MESQVTLFGKMSPELIPQTTEKTSAECLKKSAKSKTKQYLSLDLRGNGLTPEVLWETISLSLGELTTLNISESPQSRKRIYLVADFGGNRAEKIQFKPESVSGNFETVRQSFRDYRSDLAKSFGVTGTRPYDNGDNDDGRSGDTLTGQQDKSSGECLANPIRENGTGGGNVPCVMSFRESIKGGI